MALLSEKFKTSGVKIETSYGGVPNSGSGVIYSTPGYCTYDYVITAKHIFQEDHNTNLKYEKLTFIKVLYSKNHELIPLADIKSRELKSRLITLDGDLAIVIVDKVKDIFFNKFLASEEIDDEDKEFYAWGIFSANTNELNKFELTRNDPEAKRFRASSNLKHTFLHGLSGAGVFHAKKSILFGIISRYPNEEFQNSTLDCVKISFSEINAKLKSLNRIELDTESSKSKREIEGNVVDINEALINGVYLDLNLAKQRLKTDIEDDWFHDPLKYIDLLNHDYFFAELKSFFCGETFKASLAEKFHVPKKEFTLRRALLSPFIDRLIYMALVGVLGERLDKAMIPNVYSSRYSFFTKSQLILNGVEQWKKMKHKLHDCTYLKNANGEFLYKCVIKIDILNFYDNINKNLLHKKILRVCETANEISASNVLLNILKDFSSSESGLPQNSDASSLLASFYLNQVDTFIVNQVPAYYRFMDDVHIFCSDKYEARKILQLFESELRRCNLSVNSQKTRILEFNDSNLTLFSNDRDTIKRSEYEVTFDLEVNKISRLRTSRNYVNLNESFHLSLRLINDSLEKVDLNDSDEASKRLNYALNSIALLIKRTINLELDAEGFERTIGSVISSLKDKPWITTQVCKVLNLIPTSKIDKQHWSLLIEIVLNEKYNTYSFQTYQVWLLLARHKFVSKELATYAVRQIEKNDDTNRPVVAAMIIYMSSINRNFRRVLLRKFQEKFTRGDFQFRSSLISLRSFAPSIIGEKSISNPYSMSHEFTHKFKEKNLVFVVGASDEEDSDSILEQLYSI